MSRKLSPRRILKKKLAEAKQYKNALPRLIDCSNVYGDGTFTDADYAEADKEIERLEKEIAALPVHPDTIRQQNPHQQTEIK